MCNMNKMYISFLTFIIFTCFSFQLVHASSEADTMLVVPGNAEQQKEQQLKQNQYRASFMAECSKDQKSRTYCECLANEGVVVIGYKPYQQMTLKQNEKLESMISEDEGAMASIVLSAKKKCNKL